MAQCFGIMPVIGVKNEDVSALHFTWKSYRIWYCFLITCGSSFYMFCQIVYSFDGELKFDNIGLTCEVNCLFYINLNFKFIYSSGHILWVLFVHSYLFYYPGTSMAITYETLASGRTKFATISD